MIYSLEQYILFSSIYSLVSKGRFPRQEYESDILFEIFKESIKSGENIFEAVNGDKIDIINRAGETLHKKKSRIDIDKRKEKMISLFTNQDIVLNELKNRIEKELLLLEQHNIKTIVYESSKYPKHLRELEDSPFIIYYQGYFPTDAELDKSLAIIGTREPDEKYGKGVAYKVGKTLLENGWWNISGLAVGCDEYGHKGSIGATGAILAQGLATDIFPQENTELAQEILDNGGFLMSELPPSTKPGALYFVLRDRLQSGLTRGIFVVETSCKSGTLHTVKYALEQGKYAFVWDSSKALDLKQAKEVSGNIGLIDKSAKKYEFNVSIPLKLKTKVIPVLNAKILEELIREIKQDFVDKKIVELEQNKLF